MVKYTFLVAALLLCFLESDAFARKNLNSNSGQVVYSTNLDFDSTMIEGANKAPMGFFLQGRNKQSLTNMVKLRSNFKQKLRRSRSAVKALVK